MASEKKVFLGCDHAGFQLKKSLHEQLVKAFPDLEFKDVGCLSEESVDYPDFAKQVGEAVAQTGGRGILVCGSGIGMCISANKVNGVRAASAWDATSARLSREHNNANIVCVGSRLTGSEVAIELCRVWLSTPFQGGRHERRIDLITKLEAKK